jgi:uncharacterized membrane protein
MEDNRTFGEKVSDGVARFGGSWKFIFAGGLFMSVWMGFNTFLFFEQGHFDPYPFILLNLILSMVAAFQAPFIMMSQNRAEAKQDQAYRALFAEIKEMIRKEILLERKMYAIMRRLDERAQQLAEQSGGKKMFVSSEELMAQAPIDDVEDE